MQCTKIEQRVYNSENKERIKMYSKRIKEKIKEYKKNRYKTDINFELIRKRRICRRSRIYKALKRTSKSSSTKEILGIDIETYKKWLEFQFTPEMNWTNIENDHVKPICMFDISKEDELKEAFNWRNTQPLHKKDHQQKGTKYNILDYHLQFIEAYQSIKKK